MTAGTMLAAVFGGPDRLEVDEVPAPRVARDEVVVRVAANTLCGTDLRILHGRKTRGVRVPSVLGHEFAGTVAAVGSDVAGFAEGTPVAMCPVIPCRRCVHCLADRENACANRRAMGYEYDGGLAELVRVPAPALAAGNLVAAADGVPLEQLALAEPLSCCVNGHGRSRIRPGHVVVVLGAGPIGLLHLQLAHVAGAEAVLVSDPSQSRRSAAVELGATATVDPTAEDLGDIVADVTNGVGADAVILCIGRPELVNDAVRVTRTGGTVNLFAGFSGDAWASVDANAIHYKELVVTGTTAMRRRDYQRALRLIATGAVDVGRLLTHRVDLADAPRAFELAEAGAGLKVAVVP